MIQSKTIGLLKTFSVEEIKQFGLFVSSSFFNKEKVLVKFFAILKKYHPRFDGTGFKKQKVFSKLFPGKPYNDGIMRNLLSKILFLAQDYLTFKGHRTPSIDRNGILMNELASRKQEILFKRAEARTDLLIESEEIKDENYYAMKVLLNNARRDLLIKQKSNIDHRIPALLSEMHEHLTLQFIFSLLRNAIFIMNNRKRMSLKDHDIKLLAELDLFIQERIEHYKDNVYLVYYYNTYKLTADGNERYFYALKDIMKNNYSRLKEDDKKNIYVVLANYCYNKIREGNSRFNKEHFELLKGLVEKGYYLTPGGFMSHIFYMNAVIAGLGEGESRWVNDFINKHKNELDEINRENTFTFSRALFYYHNKQYDEAINAAALVETNDLSYKHQLKSFYLKIYFDMNETEPFYSHVDNYKHFISSEENASAAAGDTVLHYINFTKKLFDLKISADEKEFELKQLANEIKESHSLINKEWLLKKIEESIHPQ